MAVLFQGLQPLVERAAERRLSCTRAAQDQEALAVYYGLLRLGLREVLPRELWKAKLILARLQGGTGSEQMLRISLRHPINYLLAMVHCGCKMLI